MIVMKNPVSPGVILKEEFLIPYGISGYALAKAIGVSHQCITGIVNGDRKITPVTDLKLCKYFGLSDGWWLRGQIMYDLAEAKKNLLNEIENIKPIVDDSFGDEVIFD